MTDQTRSRISASDSGVALAAPADWLLRAAFAGVFLFHGISKFLDLEAGSERMGLPVVVWAVVAAAEVAGGAGALAGRLLPGRAGDAVTRLSGLAVAPVLIGAVAMVHWGRWSFVPTESHPMGGMEFQVVLLALALSLVARGNRA